MQSRLYICNRMDVADTYDTNIDNDLDDWQDSLDRDLQDYLDWDLEEEENENAR